MSKEELRRELEKTELFKGYANCVIYAPSINDYRSDRYSDYSMGFLSGAWFMFQELMTADKLIAGRRL